MATGYYRQDHRMGGGAPGLFGLTAGAVITVFDHIFTTGPSTWTKTVLATNDVEYQAPGGSQVVLRVENQHPATTCNFARLTARVGAVTFPTPAQVTARGQSLFRYTINSTQPFGWYAIRTDRYALIWAGGGVGANYGDLIVVGDLPVLDPNDPGMCVLLAHHNSLTAWPSGSGITSTIRSIVPTPLSNNQGWALINKANTVNSVPVYLVSSGGGMSNMAGGVYSDWGGYVPIFPVYALTTVVDATVSSSRIIHRATIPYLRLMPHRSDSAAGFTMAFFPFSNFTGDTFTVGSDTYEMFTMQNNSSYGPWCFMLNDGESLP